MDDRVQRQSCQGSEIVTRAGNPKPDGESPRWTSVDLGSCETPPPDCHVSTTALDQSSRHAAGIPGAARANQVHDPNSAHPIDEIAVF